jgi:hypothetical protein
MRALAASELLDVWERGLAQPPAERALALLSAARPESTPAELARLSIGRRDAGLLALRERTFGTRIVSLADCPRCGDRLELEFDAAEIKAPMDDDQPGTLAVEAGGREIRFRLPDSTDLLAVAGQPDVTRTRELLLQRCLIDMSVEELPADAIEIVAARMADADPQGDVQLDMTCPACGHQWNAVFDIAAFFWSEIHAWAHRTLGDVHRLATAYGWREPDILALSPWRRQVYLELAGA